MTEIRPLFAVALCLSAFCIMTACSSGEETGRQPDPARMFERLDSDQDGVISWDEFKDAGSRMESPEARFQAMDKDQDGFVTREEFIEAPRDERRRQRKGRGERNRMQ